MPVPVSDTRQANIVAGPHFERKCLGAVERTIGGLDPEPAAIRHRIARVDAQIKQRVFELVWIDQRCPEIALRGHRHLDAGPDRVVDQIRHACDQAIDVGRLRIERLTPGKRQQPMGQRRRAIRRALCGGDIAFDVLVPALRYPDLQQFEAPGNSGQQIVEIMREAAGKLADRFHLLGLPQGVFGLVQRVLLSRCSVMSRATQ